MNLATYLKSTGQSVPDLAKDLGVSAMALRHWVAGKRMPRPETMARIVAVTKGAVQPNDFFDTKNA